MITPASHEVSRVSWYSGTPTLCYLDFEYATFTLCGRPFQARFSIFSHRLYGSHNPGKNRFGLFPVRSPLLRESLTIYFPLLTKMFQFSRYPSIRLTAEDFWSSKPERFLNSEILGSKFVWQLPEAYRNLLRPSSATSPKASTIYPYIQN